MDFLRLLAAGRCGVLDAVFSGVTYFGSEIALMAAALRIFWCVDKRQGDYGFLVGALSTVCNQFLKLAFRIPRPWVLDPEFQIVESARAGATGYSFPSGPPQNIDGTTASIFAFLTALALAAALYPAFRTEQAATKTTPWILLGAAVLCGGYLVYASSLARCDWPAGSEDLANITHGLKNAYTMLGALLGFLIVYIADEKKLHFDVRAPFWGQVRKLVLGLALIVGITAGLKPLLVALFAGSQAESFVRYFLIVIFAGIVWPLSFPFFAKLGKKGSAA